jgi:YYY domain-containing protein
MLSFLAWYLLVSALGWLTFPLAFRLFPALADRGFSLARALGMLVWGYVFWSLASLGIVQNDGGGLLLGLVVLAAISGSGLARKETRKSMGEWIGSNGRVIVTVEILFFLAFAFLAFVRAGNPEILGTEKPMELAFINAILHSPTFPPHDPWLSGYAISYYYFGYVMTAMLAKATGTLGSVAFNLMLSLVFAMSAVGAYGVLYNLLAAWRKKAPSPAQRRPLTGLPLLGPFFLLIVSNFEGFLQALYSLGLFWKINADGTATSSFWSWLGILDLNQPPAKPLGLMSTNQWWWGWRASRVVTDYTLANAHTEIIDEFPAFSYLLGDLHPHVLAMPFGLLAVGVALNLFMGGWKGETNLGFYRLPVRPMALFFGALVLGGLAFLNTWDILSGFTLLVGAYALMRALESGWAWKRLEDVFALGVPLGLLAILLYLPFYAGFSSQAGGILPNLENPTRGVQLWVMFGPLFLAIIAYLIYLWRLEKRPANWRLGFGLAAILVVLLWIFSWLLGLLAKLKMPDFVASYLSNEGFLNAALYFSAATLRRLSFIGGLLTLLILLGTALAFLLSAQWGGHKEEAVEEKEELPSPFVPHLVSFILFLILLGTLLVLAPEFVFLRDQFNNRMNTIFKFYYQAWMLWSLAAAFGVAILLQNLRGPWKWIYRIGLTLVLFMALVYPVLGLLTKTDNFQIPAFNQNLETARAAGDKSPWQTAARVWTLDGGAFFDRVYPDDMSAAAWLSTASYGIIVEASKPDASYTDYSFISTYSGLPTVLGWPMHEGQWRGSFEPQGTRQDDIRRLYETSSWAEAQTILSQYGIHYVCVGTLERSTYHLNESKFQQHLTPVFQQGQVVIYEVP